MWTAKYIQVKNEGKQIIFLIRYEHPVSDAFEEEVKIDFVEDDVEAYIGQIKSIVQDKLSEINSINTIINKLINRLVK